MGRSKVGTRPNEFKYGMALYGAAWPEGDYYYVCGGGGHGLVPRIVWAQYKNGRCSDQLGEYKLGKDTPMRMIMCPWGSSLLLGNAHGGIRRLQIGMDDPSRRQPKLVEVSAAFQEVMSGLSDEVGTMAFNARGSLLAVGFKETGAVKVVGYPSMRTLAEWKLKDPEVKDLDFCRAPGLGAELLATVAGDGSCQVWSVADQGHMSVVAQLEPPKVSAKSRFIRCRFSRAAGPRGAPHGGLMQLFVLVNAGRDASYLAAYAPLEGAGTGQAGAAAAPAAAGGSGGGAAGAPQQWQLVRKVKAKDQPASAMDISRDGRWIAAGFADGALRVFDSDSLLLRSEAEASIAFVSGVAFNGDCTAAIAVGGDANCYVMELEARRRGGTGACGWLLVLLLLLLVALALAVLHFWQHPEVLPYSALQQLQALSREQQPLAQACRSDSASSFPLQEHVCEWVQRAASVLPDESWHHQEL